MAVQTLETLLFLKGFSERERKEGRGREKREKSTPVNNSVSLKTPKFGEVVSNPMLPSSQVAPLSN